MESERKRSRLSSSLTARKSEIQWEKCGDGFEELMLNIPKRNVSARRNSRHSRETHRRKSLTDVLLKERQNPKRSWQQTIDDYSSDEDSCRNPSKPNKCDGQKDDIINANNTDDISQFSSELLSIEEVDSFGGNKDKEAMYTNQEYATACMEEEISDYDDEDLYPPLPVFGDESPAVISTCSTENCSETDSSAGGENHRKSSEWIKNLKWHSKTPEKSQNALHATQLDDSGKKKKKLTKNGFADRLEKVIAREKSAVRFRTHRMSTKGIFDDKCGVMSVEVMSTQEDHSHLVCVCKTCPESKHFLATNSEPELNTDHEMPVVVFFGLNLAKKLEITAGSTVHISPPWQKMCVPVQSEKTFCSVILCTQFSKVDNSKAQLDTQKTDESEQRVVSEWCCSCQRGRILSKECTNEMRPVLPRKFTQVLSDNSDTMNSATKQMGLSVVSNKLSYKEMTKPQNCSILDSIERGGPTVNFTATLQRIFRQSSTIGIRWSLLLQDEEGSMCEVVLPQDLSSCSNQWQTLQQSEGKKVEASGLRIQQRVNFSSVSGMFSLIQSLWTEDMAKKFNPRKGYSQDSEELQSTSQSNKIRMPGFCYKLTMSGEEGLVKPMATIPPGEDKSPLYCDPLIVTLKDIPQLPQPLRITMFAQLIYRILSDTSKLQDVFYCRDTSVSGFASIIMRGTHSEEQTNTGKVYYFKDVLLESDKLYVDGYSMILPLHSLPDTLCSKAPIDDMEVLKNHDVHLEELSLNSCPYALVSVKGFVGGVDEETACSWLTCSKCGSNKLSGGTAQNPFLHCDVCEIGVNKPVTRMHLEVYLTNTEWEGKTTVKVQLLQRTIQKLLPSTMDDDGYEMSSVLDKHIGPITCVLLKCNEMKDGRKLMHLEEISFVS